MRIHLLYLLPVFAGCFSLLPVALRYRFWVFQLSAWGHFALTLSAWVTPISNFTWHNTLGLDAKGLLFLTATSIIYALVSVYVPPWLRREMTRRPLPNDAPARRAATRRGPLSIAADSVFLSALSLFVGAMTLVELAQNMALLWILIEATTLASVPLLYFYRQPQALEALWKYLIICSVGIAVALLGTFCLAAAYPIAHASAESLQLNHILEEASSLQPAWLKLALGMLLIGYGTKVGLAPMHTWLPDAHAEAPSPASALLSGSLLNCALLGILRARDIAAAAGLEGFMQPLLLGFGLLSVGVAALFILRQPDYKRLLAYSSIENMGLVTFGFGIGSPLAVLGASLHLLNHSLVKASLFLSAGNLLQTYGSKYARHLRGLVHTHPFTGILWLFGLLAIVGAPPAGLFISKLILIRAGLQSGHIILVILLLIFLIPVVAGLGGVALRMTHGRPFAHDPITNQPTVVAADGLSLATPSLRMRLIPLFLLLLSVYLCLFPPTPLLALIQALP